jgi:hypothetical protein
MLLLRSALRRREEGADETPLFERDISPGGRPESGRAGFGFDPRIGVADAPMLGTRGPCIFRAPMGTRRDEDPSMLRTPLATQTAPDGEPLCHTGVVQGSCQKQVAGLLGLLCVRAGEGGGVLPEPPAPER